MHGRSWSTHRIAGTEEVATWSTIGGVSCESVACCRQRTATEINSVLVWLFLVWLLFVVYLDGAGDESIITKHLKINLGEHRYMKHRAAQKEAVALGIDHIDMFSRPTPRF